MAQCKFSEAWIGQCKMEVADNVEYCHKHKNEVCCNCCDQATHSCAETGGFVCGASLCDNCEHTLGPDGCNSGMLGSAKLPEGMNTHCKKDEQRFKPWYMKPPTDTQPTEIVFSEPKSEDVTNRSMDQLLNQLNQWAVRAH